MNLNSKHHVWWETRQWWHLQSTIPKVKCAGSRLMLWGCFSVAETEGLVRVEEKLSAPKYWALMKTKSRAFRTSDWAEGSTSKRTMTLSTQQQWLIDNSVNVLEWPSHSLGLNAIKHFWGNLKMCICSHPTWQSLRCEKMRRKMAEKCQILIWKLVIAFPKRLEAVKVLPLSAELRVWRMLCTYLILLFFNNFCFCVVIMVHLSLWCICHS